MDIDGAVGNSVIEMNTASVPAGPSNPYLGAFVVQETLLHHEQEAQRQLNLAASRTWKVINPSVKNALGQPVGYMLVPGENSVPYAAPTSPMRKRAGFINAHLWITPYDPTTRCPGSQQTHAAGYDINQSEGGGGLPQWISTHRAIANQDIVLWYTMGITPIPRPEEWPVMPVHRTGCKRWPNGCFARNPALDVPKPESC